MTPQQTLAALAMLAQDPVAPVPSPCISVCRMDDRNGLCGGCYRSIDEIIAWSRLSDGAKRAVWRSIVLRAGAAASSVSPTR